MCKLVQTSAAARRRFEERAEQLVMCKNVTKFYSTEEVRDGAPSLTPGYALGYLVVSPRGTVCSRVSGGLTARA